MSVMMDWSRAQCQSTTVKSFVDIFPIVIGNSYSHRRLFSLLPIPIPKLEFYSHSHGIRIPIGNPILMVVPSSYRARMWWYESKYSFYQ